MCKYSTVWCFLCYIQLTHITHTSVTYITVCQFLTKWNGNETLIKIVNTSLDRSAALGFTARFYAEHSIAMAYCSFVRLSVCDVELSWSGWNS